VITEYRKNDDIIIDSLARIETTLDTIGGQVSRHDKAIYGNGKEGIVTDVSNLKQRWSIAKYLVAGSLVLVVGEIVSEII